MKVVDDLGEEVKYLGLLFPEDQQSLRSVVPNCLLQSAFVDTASFEPNVLPQLLLREDGVVFGYNGLDDVPLNIEHPDVDINQEYF
ncbi:hypothetical protein L195_g062527, partial [Trifolium pratense]